MGRGEQTSWKQLDIVLEWLEQPANFNLITGVAPKGKPIAGQKTKKSDAYKDLAAFVNQKLFYSSYPSIWDAKKAKSRYESLLKKYKEVKKQHLDLGGPKFCLTEQEMAKGTTYFPIC